MIEVALHSLGVEQETNQPVIILRDLEGARMLPIWIGTPEAHAIMVNFQDVAMPRPMTHDLLFNTIRALGFAVQRVEITDLRETTFYANIVLFDGTNTVELDARPSDSIALAVRAGCPIFVDDEVMDAAGRPVEADDELGDDEAEREVEEFREFLASVDPEDFAGAS
jgi:bifunctional DNase/RNase